MERRKVEAGSAGSLKAREGDKITVTIGGAKLSIAAYSTVETDGAIYERALRDGEDAGEQFDAVHSFLRRRVEEVMRAKLATFSDELAKAKTRARGE